MGSPRPRSILRSRQEDPTAYHSNYRLAQMKGEIERVRGLFVEVRRWKSELSSMVGALQSSVTEMQSNMDADIAEKAWLDQTKSKLETVVEQLTSSSGSHDTIQMVPMLQDQVERLLDQISSMEHERVALIKTNSALQTELSHTTRTSSAVQGRLSECASRHDALLLDIMAVEQAVIQELDRRPADGNYYISNL